MKKILKRAAVIFVFTVVGALIIRAAISTDKSVFDDFMVTDESRSAYADGGKLTVGTLDLKHYISMNGYFSAYSMYYVEETGELQITVRYNNSALDYTKTEKHEDFEFMLVKRTKAVDLTGKSAGDIEEETQFDLYDGEYYLPETVDTESRWGLYKYRKLIFKNVELTQTDEIALVLAPKGATVPSPEDDALIRKEAYDTYFDMQNVHYKDQPFEEYKLSKSDKKEINS
ncbi:MAG: hypothetical protein IKM46_01240 [Clostridia bacterium]|nr:hypothetical protein [Clostridia bacterium]